LISFGDSVYNISGFGPWSTTVYVPSGNTTIAYNFEGNICDWTPTCLDRRGQPIHSYLCYHNNSIGVNMGKAPSISEATPGGGMRFDYVSGSQSPWTSSTCFSSLSILCDYLGDNTAELSSDITDLNNNCHVDFIIYSKYGCRQCLSSDIGYFDTECVAGLKTRTFYLLGVPCYGGVPVPSTLQIECGSEVTVRTQTVVVAVFFSVAIFAGAIAGLVFLYMKNKKLHHDYTQLVNQNIPMDSKEETNTSEL